MGGTGRGEGWGAGGRPLQDSSAHHSTHPLRGHPFTRFFWYSGWDSVPLLTPVKLQFVKAKLSGVPQLVNDAARRRNCYKPGASASPPRAHDSKSLLKKSDSPGISERPGSLQLQPEQNIATPFFLQRISSTRCREKRIPFSSLRMQSMTGCWPRSGCAPATSTSTRPSPTFCAHIWCLRCLARLQHRQLPAVHPIFKVQQAPASPGRGQRKGGSTPRRTVAGRGWEEGRQPQGESSLRACWAWRTPGGGQAWARPASG